MKLSPKTTQSNSKKVAIISVLVFTSIFIAFDISPIGGSNLRLYSKWMSCGVRPFQDEGLLEGEVIHYSSAPVFEIFRGSSTSFFCSEREAELAGYSANKYQYDFPHLNVEERKAVMRKYQ